MKLDSRLKTTYCSQGGAQEGKEGVKDGSKGVSFRVRLIQDLRSRHKILKAEHDVLLEKLKVYESSPAPEHPAMASSKPS